MCLMTKRAPSPFTTVKETRSNSARSRRPKQSNSQRTARRMKKQRPSSVRCSVVDLEETAQDFEKLWWSDCTNTFGEEAKQLTYAHRMGLVNEPREGKWPVY